MKRAPAIQLLILVAVICAATAFAITLKPCEESH
jgi:hypothetical protein